MATVRVYLGLGSNLGDRRRLIGQAVEALRRLSRTAVRRVSSLHETDPVGGPPGQGRYLNAVAEIETGLPPRALLTACQAIERDLGRKRSIRWGPRPMDLDILFYGAQSIQDDDLIVPHPRLWGRLFVLRPLAELAPALVAAGPVRWREALAEAGAPMPSATSPIE